MCWHMNLFFDICFSFLDRVSEIRQPEYIPSEQVRSRHTVIPYPANSFCPENVVCFLHLLHIFKSTVFPGLKLFNSFNPYSYDRMWM